MAKSGLAKLFLRTALAASAVAPLVFLSQSVLADGTPRLPTLIKNAGNPVLLRFPDGREAILKKSAVVNGSLAIPFTISENTCNDNVGTSCSYTIPLTNAYLFFAWSKNPDSTKLNHELEIPVSSTNTTSRKVEFTMLITSLSKTPDLDLPEVVGVPNQSISCKDFDWFEPNDPAQAGARKIRTISTEFTVPNNETGVSENRYFFTVRDISLGPVLNQTALVTGASITPNLTNPIPVLFFGDSGWYVKNKSGDVCQFTARGDVNAATSAFSAIDAKRVAPESEKTVYVYGNKTADGFYQIDFNIDSLMNSGLETSL